MCEHIKSCVNTHFCMYQLYGRFLGEGIRNFGFYDLIESLDLVDRCLIDGHALWLFCEVHIFSSLVTQLHDVQDIKVNPASKKH